MPIRPLRIPPLRALTALLTLGLSLAASACGTDDASSPTAPAVPHPDVAATATNTSDVLTWSTPLVSDVSTSVVIGRKGGVIQLAATGLKVIVPANAVADDVLLTVTARSGYAVVYDFGPHMRFAAPLVFTQDLRRTNIWKVPDAAAVQGGYVGDMSTVDATAGVAVVDELMPAKVDLAGSKLRFDIAHFSGYVIVTGKGNKP